MFGVVYAMSGAGQGQAQGGGGIYAFLPFILIIVIFYFLMIRPQQKKQKEHQKMLGHLQKGDKVVTNGGMFGTIVGINEKDNIIVLKIGEDVKVEFLRSSIAGKIEKGS
jgi:preprotein translocase subunit YajC